MIFRRTSILLLILLHKFSFATCCWGLMGFQKNNTVLIVLQRPVIDSDFNSIRLSYTRLLMEFCMLFTGGEAQKNPRWRSVRNWTETVASKLIFGIFSKIFMCRIVTEFVFTVYVNKWFFLSSQLELYFWLLNILNNCQKCLVWKKIN